MTLTGAELERHLGYFGPFMAAWGEADEETRAAAYAETRDYRAGLIDGATEVRDVSALLGIPPPAGL